MSITREKAASYLAEASELNKEATEAIIVAIMNAYDDGFAAGEETGRKSQHELSTKAERDRCAHVIGVNALELQSRIASGQ